MAKHGNDGLKVLKQLRQDKDSGKIVRTFEDEFFALDLLKILYDDTVDGHVKAELLILLEEYGALGTDSDSVDQLVTSLLDIYHQCVDRSDNWTFVSQALITSTSLLIQLQQLDSDVCRQLIKELVTIVTSRVNQPDSHRLRSCACQCLIQLETCMPGLLFVYHDEFGRVARQERTPVFQDCVLLAAIVIESVGLIERDTIPNSPINLDIPKQYQKQVSYEANDLRQIAGFIVEHVPLYTRCGLYRVVDSLVNLVKNLPEVSPMIFKPLMLHQMSSMSGVLFHTVLYLQREFEGEILTLKEEGDLIDRLCLLTDHPCITTLHKLLVNQWTQYYKLTETDMAVVHDSIVSKYRLKFYPTVFDPVDCQLAKLYMTSVCGDTSNDVDGMETCILLGSLGCLHKLTWHTGSCRAAIALFKALYFIYLRHNNYTFSQDIQRFVRGLIAEFPHFIPHSIDFIDNIDTLGVDSKVYVETLHLLHQQIVMATDEQVCHSNQYYLLIMKKAALETNIEQHATLKFLNNLCDMAPQIDDSSWKLGHGILEIAHNLLLCHGTDKYYIEIGDVLYNMMTSYNDTDVQDKARFYYALMTSASDKKLLTVLQNTMGDVDSMNQTLHNLLPGVNEKDNLAKIIQLEDPVFQWERVSVDMCQFKGQDDTTQMVIPNSGSQDFLQYLQQIADLDVSINITCRLSLTENCEFPQVHAVTIHVDSSDNYKDIPDIHVPCLGKSDVHNVVLKLKPKLPLPQVLSCQIIFACDKRSTYRALLPTINVMFYHVMMPLPWRPDYGYETQFYQDMSQWILNPQQNLSKPFESLKMFNNLSSAQFDQIHRTKLEKYQICTKADDSIRRYAMFLPPKHHLLLRCECKSFNTLVVTIVMDSYTLLPHVDKYLDDIMSTD